MSVNFTPQSIAAGEIPPASKLNSLMHDPWTAIQAPWDTYTPTWTAVTTNPVLGNGTLVGAYSQVGKTIRFRIVLTMGSTSTYGSGRFRLTLPITPATAARVPFLGECYDSSTSTPYPFYSVVINSSGTMDCNAWGPTAGGASGIVNATNPFAWASGDTLVVSGTYEAA